MKSLSFLALYLIYNVLYGEITKILLLKFISPTSALVDAL